MGKFNMGKRFRHATILESLYRFIYLGFINNILDSLFILFQDVRNSTYYLGTGDCNQDYCNGEFTPGMQYYLKVRGFTQSTYRDSQPINFIIYKYNLLLIIGVIVSVIVATLLLFTIFYLRRKQLHVEVKRIRNISNNIPLFPKPIPVKQFPLYYADVKDNSIQIKTEFKELNCEPPSITAATLPVNKKKNRYVDILPCMYLFTVCKILQLI